MTAAGARWSRQSGASTLELLIAMAVTGAVMGALVGVVYVANLAVNRWQQPLSVAATRPMFEILAVALETDSETYVPCRVTASELDFGDARCQSFAVTYTLAGTDIVRSGPSGQQVLSHRLAATPTFSKTCSVQNGIVAGTIVVGNLVYGVPIPDLRVYYNTAEPAPC